MPDATYYIQDKQEIRAWGYCEACGGEIYEGDKIYRIGYDFYHADCVHEEIAGEGDR